MPCPRGAPYGEKPVYPINQGRPVRADGWRVALDQCNPAKTGYSSILPLLGFAAGNMWGHGARTTVIATTCRDPQPGETPNAKVPSVLVVRNPYERLLSGYLGQVAHNSKAAYVDVAIARANRHLYFMPRAIPMNRSKYYSETELHSGYADWEPSPEAFADFVQKLTAKGVPFVLGG